jgi:hypothetical protein
MVDAVSEDAWSCTVEMRLEKVAELAAIEEMVREPAGFVMAVELSWKSWAVGARMFPVTVRLLVRMALEAVRKVVLNAGAVMGSEKRRSVAR